jgi:hypothetical protein
MSGGEPTALAEVLHAKEALELPSTDFAYELVLKDLEARGSPGDGDARLIVQAAAALAASRKPVGRPLKESAGDDPFTNPVNLSRQCGRPI